MLITVKINEDDVKEAVVEWLLKHKKIEVKPENLQPVLEFNHQEDADFFEGYQIQAAEVSLLTGKS